MIDEHANKVTQTGDHAVNIINNGGKLTVNGIHKSYRTLLDASADLRSWYGFVYKDKHIKRNETSVLLKWIEKNAESDSDRVHLLVGEAGSGKSVILRDVLISLEQQGIKVLGLKADHLFSNFGTLDELVGVGDSTVEIIRNIAQNEKFVLIIDQVDALSLSLSSNRSSLESVNTLVNEMSKYANVRVIVSCRPYDLNYDPMLERYKSKTVTKVEDLPLDEVKDTLNIANIHIDENTDVVWQFLANPLNLFLFCKVQNSRLFGLQHPNRNLLYKALWKQILVDNSKLSENVTYQGLVECLNDITSIMYRRQVLSVSYEQMETKYSNEINYLLSNSFLYNENGKLQFIHQSLYDFIYARIFLQKGKSIRDTLDGVHQGLFIRLRVKQILLYLRDVDIDAYIDNLKMLFFDKTTDEKYTYRFHLKHLMLSSMGYVDNLYDEECGFLRKYIFPVQELSEIFWEAVSTEAGLNLLISEIDRRGGFASANEEQQDQLLRACSRTMYNTKGRMFVVDYLLSLDNSDFKLKSKENLLNLINYIPVNQSEVSQIIHLAKKFDEHSSKITFPVLLRNLVPYAPEFIGSVIISNINEVLNDESSGKGLYQYDFSYDLESLLEELQKEDEERGFLITLKVVQTICRNTIFIGQDSNDIKSSMAYFSYNRHSDYYKFEDKALNYLLSQVETISSSHCEKISDVLKKLSTSDLAVDVLIAVCGYRANIKYFLQDAYNVLERIMKSEYVSSVLEYYAIELFGSLFTQLSTEKKEQIMLVLANLNPNWEKNYVPNRSTISPLTFIGYTKAKYYRKLNDDDLKCYPSAKAALLEIEHKYGELENKEPNEMKVKTGWNTLRQSAYNTMGSSELAESMVGIDSNNSTDWDKPSLTGHAMAMRDNLSCRPDDYYQAYLTAIDQGADITYAVLGVEGLLDVDYTVSSINILVDKIIAQLDTEVNNNNPGTTIQVVRLIDRYYDKDQFVPDSLFEFVCKVACEWDDSEYNKEEYSNASYNDGINQVRGCAADTLLRCYEDKDRVDIIFEVLNRVAENAAISTRASALFRMGILFDVNEEKCKELFLKLTKDYATSLLNLPLHKLNPLIKLVNYDFQALENYFEACIGNYKTHKINVALLWICWVRKIEMADQYMYRMADSSIEGRAALITYVCDQFSIGFMDKISPILGRYLDYDEKETGSAYDNVFTIIMKWGNNEQVQFMKTFVKSNACKYCSYHLMKYLKSSTSIFPNECLQWIPKIYESKKGQEDWPYYSNNLIDVLISSYNSIRKYDKNNRSLEEALDLLDLWLHDSANRQYLFNYFKLLDN